MAITSSEMCFSIETELIYINGVRFLKVRVEAKNVGTVSCHFAPLSNSTTPLVSGLRFHQKAWKSIQLNAVKVRDWGRMYYRFVRGEANPYTNKSKILLLRGRLLPTTPFAFNLIWDTPEMPWGGTQLFPNQQWIRSGETIADEYLFQLSDEDVIAVRVEARLAGKSRILRPCGDEWHACSVLAIKQNQIGNQP